MKKNIESTLPDLSNPTSVVNFLQQPSKETAEFLTGILAASNKEWILSAGRLVQATVKCDLFMQLGRELKYYIDLGKIKEDYFATNKNQSTVMDLLKFIDGVIPDEELFIAMKSIFFTSIEYGATSKEEFLAYEFLQTAKRLSGTEVLILKSIYQLAVKPKEVNRDMNYNTWASNVATNMGLSTHTAIIEKYDDNLSSLKLITRRIYDDFSGVRIGNRYRLTDAGYEFCQYITNYPDKLM